MSKLLAHLLTAAALLLVAAAPSAWGNNSTAPGALKKVTPGGDTGTPAPAPAPTATPAPAPQAQPKVQAPKLNAKTPVTKGTVKKLATTAPATTSAPAPRVQRTRTARVSTRHRAASHGAGSKRAAARTHTAGAAAAAARRTAARRSQIEAAARQRAAAAAARHRRHVAVHAASAEPKRAHDSGGLASINRAADHVIEVIPGALVLALAGLIVLVLVLIVRSWLMERRRTRALEESYGVTVQALATAIEAKDHTTGGHIERVRELGLLLARELAPRDVKDPQMAYGFLLHDIGKLAVPDAILRAPGRLTEPEWALMRRHPLEGVRILASIPFLGRAVEVVRHHHERWDGAGYPDGLAGSAIPLWARIFSVADALDAMTAERPYRARQPYEQALEEIRRNAGTQFDPAVVATLERMDHTEIERLLEPAQVLDRTGGREQLELEPLEAMLAAADSARPPVTA
ncbi:MAG: HD-GYP domain-containing protein [Thermoleophilaceae bacterium]